MESKRESKGLGASTHRLSRRQFVVGTAATVGGAAMGVPSLALSEASTPFQLSSQASAALAESPLVYISPLLAGGQESRCHGEVWFFADQGDVVIFTSKDSWKSRALTLKRNKARIWVGDFGPVWRALGRYRKAPSFLSQAEVDSSPATFDRLMADYSQRYADEWGKWEPRFRKGYVNKTSELIRYRPISA